MASRRKEIVEFLVTELKKIDGQTSTFNVSYTYSNNLFNNVFRKLKFLDEVNDFPAIYISAGTEIRDFNSKSFNSTLGNLIADIIFIQSDSVFKYQEDKNIDFVIQNHGGIRASLPKGEVKLTDAYKILPFENEIVIVEMDGKSIYEIVSFLKNETIPHPFSGLTINGDEVLVQSRLIIPTNKYYIATNDYLLTGGDNMFFFNKNTEVYRLGYSLRDAFIDYTKSNLYLSSKIDNRFIKNE